MVLIEEISRGPLSSYGFESSSATEQRKHRLASKVSSDCDVSFLEEQNNTNNNGNHHRRQHYPILLALVPIVTLLYMAACDNLKSNSEVFVFSLGVLSYVIGMDLVMAQTLSPSDMFVE